MTGRERRGISACRTGPSTRRSSGSWGGTARAGCSRRRRRSIAADDRATRSQPRDGAGPRDRSGRGDKNAADQAAVDAMRLMIDTVSMDGVVVIGEGEKDEAPMLFNGEQVGDGNGPATDVAVDPIDGTRLTSVGQPNALAVIALAPRGAMFFPGAALYMEKLATGPEAAEMIDIEAPVAENIRQVAKAKGKRPEEVTVTILDRDRHTDTIAQIRDVGARVFLITDGDVAGAIVAAAPRTEVDLLIGIGGTP